MEGITKIDLGELYSAGVQAVLTGFAYGVKATCNKCGKPIGEWAYCYHWAHNVRDDPSISNLMLFCSTECLIAHLKSDA